MSGQNEEDLARFLEPAPGIQCDHPEVVELARRVARGAEDDVEAARRLFLFVRDKVRYSPYIPFDRLSDYLALNTLARGKGYCVQKSALLVALARGLGLPARLGFADIANHQLPEGLSEMLGSEVMAHHCFVEWYLAGRWLKVTPSFEEELCRQRGWELVEFSAEQDGLLPARDLAGRPHISYLRYLGHRRGVPLEEILESWYAEYGRQRVDAWARAGEPLRAEAGYE